MIKIVIGVLSWNLGKGYKCHEKYYYNSASDVSENIIIVSHGDLLSVFNSMKCNKPRSI